MTGRGAWRRACPAGQVLDLLHARVTEPYAPHVHEEYAVGACTAGREVIRYRGTLHYAGPGSVVSLATLATTDMKSTCMTMNGPAEVRTYDVPHGTWRFTRPPAGMRATVVGGTSTWLDGASTGARPGVALNSNGGA